jgi:hypothetical protein
VPVLLPFDWNQRFKPEQCLEDKIELSLGRWSVEAEDLATLNAFKEFLAGPPDDGNEWSVFMDGGPYGWMFKRPGGGRGHNRDRNKLSFRLQALKTPERTLNAPLCSGYANLEFKRRAFGRPGFNIKLMLSLNLLRFLRHQPKDETAPMKNVATRPDRLRRREKRPAFGDEFSYDGADNWLPETPEWRSFAKHDRCWRLLRRYCDGIAEEFERHLENATGHAGATLGEREEYFTIKSTETVWETTSSAPIPDALQIGDVLFRNSRPWADAAFRTFKNSPGAIREANSVRVAIPLSGGAILRVYAKTNRRIRFEVLQDSLADDRKAIRREAGLPEEEPTRRDEMPVRPLSELLPMVKAIRKRAAGRINQLMQRISDVEGGEERGVSGIELLAEIAGAVAFAQGQTARTRLAADLLSVFLVQGGWRGTAKEEAAADIGRALAILKKRGVLKGERGRQHLAIAPRFAQAAAALRELSPATLSGLFGGTVGETPG